ncbi:hypothetical protein [uncultured Mycolicibacterium sp.]|uniref:PPE domain-containing protein n=1 Tax=uncultured Mycolicibacterium sp. TaxID=2320817 RepID=UPI0026349E46|nr:hypothetical protein [uncultured Mycolicibacterium sp.]
MTSGQPSLKVDPETLLRKREQLLQPWPAVPPAPDRPSAFAVSVAASDQLSASRDRLAAVLERGRLAAERLAECLAATAAAYRALDEAAGGWIAGDGHGRVAAVVPAFPDFPPLGPLPEVAHPPAPAAPGIDWQLTWRQLNDGDQGASLQTFAAALYRFSDEITDLARVFSLWDTHWEGAAARAAEHKVREFESWMYDIASAARELAKQAHELAALHHYERDNHPDDADIADVNRRSGMDAVAAYFTNQQESERVQADYADKADRPALRPGTPPTGEYTAMPVAVQDLPERRSGGPTAGGVGAPGRSDGAAGTDGAAPAGPPAGIAAPRPATAAAAVRRPGEEAPAAAAGGGGPAGGTPGGGTSGAGTPGGGTSGGGTPVPSARPEPARMRSTGPRLRPAGTGAGAPGLGTGGPAGGAAAPPQPPVTAETVAPAPRTAGRGPAPVGAGPGSAGGPVGGGFAPMAPGLGQNQAKDRRRDPNVVPDTDLYIEDRPWTEPVIGNRRRTVPKGGSERDGT